MNGANPTHIVKRLRRARESLGLSQEEAARQAGLGTSGRQILSDVENNRRILKAAELAALARVYRRAVDFFFREAEEVEPIVYWRGDGDRSVRASFLQYCDGYAELEALTGQRPLPSFAPARVERTRLVPRPGKRDYDEAARLAARYLPDRCDFPARMMEELLVSTLGVKVVYMEGEAASGACSVGEFGAAVLVRADEVPWRRAFTMAHELFHLITWDVACSPEDSCDVQEKADEDMEKLANSFAAALLMPEAQVRNFIDPRIRGDKKLAYPDLIAMARTFGVSLQSALWRLANLGYVDSSQARDAMESSDFEHWRGVRGNEDWTKPICPSARFVDLGVTAMHGGHISRAKLAGYLGIALGELDYHLAQLGYSREEEALIEMPAS